MVALSPTCAYRSFCSKGIAAHVLIIKIWDKIAGKEQHILKVNTYINPEFFDDPTAHLHTDIGPIKLSVKSQAGAKSTVIAQVPSPCGDSVQARDECERIVDDAQKANHCGYWLSTDKCWITWNKHNILWLPPEYRPYEMEVWRYESQFTSSQTPSDVVMALCNGSGKVVIIRISSSELYPLT